MMGRPSRNLLRSTRTPDLRNGRRPTRSARTFGFSILGTWLHSETIGVVVAGSAARWLLGSFVPPKTQSFVRGIVYMSGVSLHTNAKQKKFFFFFLLER